MASPTRSNKLRILLIPFFASSHIGPFTDLAFHLAAARPGAVEVEATVAVTPANASVVRSALARRGPSAAGATVQVATYAFPAVDGLLPGVENLSTVAAADAWRIDAAAWDEALMRPGQERLIRERSPDAIVTDAHFFWNVDVAADLGVPCIMFHAIAIFDIEASGKSFLWVVRGDTWMPPEGWKERVGDRGMVVTGWALQTAILSHPAVGAFVTHCGWNSVMETIAAGVPVLTWPMVVEQFITERFVTEVLAIGERLWPEGAGVRSTRSEEHELIPAEAVARAVARFMEPGGGAGDAARSRVKELSAKAHAAMAEGGSSHHDLRRLIDDLIEGRTACAGTMPMSDTPI